jgi:hypothetical protein
VEFSSDDGNKKGRTLKHFYYDEKEYFIDDYDGWCTDIQQLCQQERLRELSFGQSESAE